jgi:hypothetical protein
VEEEEDAAMRSRSSCNKVDRFAFAILFSGFAYCYIITLSHCDMNDCDDDDDDDDDGDFILFKFPPKMLFAVLYFNSISFCLFYFLACFFLSTPARL